VPRDGFCLCTFATAAECTTAIQLVNQNYLHGLSQTYPLVANNAQPQGQGKGKGNSGKGIVVLPPLWNVDPQFAGGSSASAAEDGAAEDEWEEVEVEDEAADETFLEKPAISIYRPHLVHEPACLRKSY
jgi:hypothetical protein